MHKVSTATPATASGRATSWPRRRVLAVAPAVLAGLAAGRLARAAELRFFRIGTGSTAGTYFPVGGLIASVISNPPGSRECARGGSCGVPGMIAAAVSTKGSVENIEAVASGALESGLGQADVAYWAHSGTGIFKTRGAVAELRTIANLFPESAHIVVRRDLSLRGVEDLKGRRLSIDREGSGTRVDALLILEAFGLGPHNMDLVSVSAAEASDMLRRSELDGFFMVAGTPAGVVSQLANEALINLLPIAGPKARKLAETVPFFAPITVRSGTYFNVGLTETLSVGAQWLVSAAQSEELVYQVTRALWHENARRLLDNGHPKAALIRLETALDGLGAPLHPGAERYYREIGLIAEGAPIPGSPESR